MMLYLSPGNFRSNRTPAYTLYSCFSAVYFVESCACTGCLISGVITLVSLFALPCADTSPQPALSVSSPSMGRVEAAEWAGAQCLAHGWESVQWETGQSNLVVNSTCACFSQAQTAGNGNQPCFFPDRRVSKQVMCLQVKAFLDARL